jgi:predicted class III extradiol MEMO1 family dioxygenase
MVGATNAEKEREYGRFFAPYVANEENLFIISSDFCHWYAAIIAEVTQGFSISIYILQQAKSSFD